MAECQNCKFGIESRNLLLMDRQKFTSSLHLMKGLTTKLQWLSLEKKQFAPPQSGANASSESGATSFWSTAALDVSVSSQDLYQRTSV
jgi:hypothetical protein